MRLQKNKVFLTVIFFACGIGAGCFYGSPAYAAGNIILETYANRKNFEKFLRFSSY